MGVQATPATKIDGHLIVGFDKVRLEELLKDTP